MAKSRLSLLIVAMVIAALLIAGCTTSNQTSQEPGQIVSTNASTSSTSSSTSTAASSSVASASPTVSPSPSASPTAGTPTPAPSGKIATSIQFARDPSVVGGWAINVISSTSGIRICSLGAVTVSGEGGQTIGTVSSGGSSDCYHTAYLDTSSLNPGTSYYVILKFAGDSTYQPSQSTATITA